MFQLSNPQDEGHFILPNVNESLIIANFQLTAKSFLGKDAPIAEAIEVSADIHKVNQFLLKNALLAGTPNWLYQKVPQFLPGVRKAERAIKSYAQEAVNSPDSPLVGFMSALINAGPDGSGILTEEAQRDEVILAIISSYVSTATAIGWVLYFLGKSEFSHYQEKVRQEFRKGEVSLPTSLTSLIVKEALRLYPPVFIMTRKVTEEISVDNERGKLQLPQGSTLFVSPYLTQRDPKYWKNPNQFYPERFSDPFEALAYLPFGLGLRKCIGEHYLMKVATTSVGYILDRYKMSILRSPNPMFRATLHPSYDFMLKADKLH
jgi:cytochrome P450